jgi:hypothetical protein
MAHYPLSGGEYAFNGNGKFNIEQNLLDPGNAGETFTGNASGQGTVTLHIDPTSPQETNQTPVLVNMQIVKNVSGGGTATATTSFGGTTGTYEAHVDDTITASVNFNVDLSGSQPSSAFAFIEVYFKVISAPSTPAYPSFSNLNAPKITYGTATTTVSGHLNSNSSQSVPAGETVAVTLGGVTENATLDTNDDFSASFDTHALGVQGSPYTISFAYAGDSNFLAADGSSTLTVKPAPLTVTVNDGSKAQGAPNPDFTASYQGFVNSEGPANLGGQLTFSTNATMDSPAGKYLVAASGLTSDNYNISYQPGMLTIKSSPSFSNLSMPTITYGTKLTAISGHLDSGSIQPVPEGDIVGVTVKGETQPTTLDSHGNFSVLFDTHALGVQGSPYTISFVYAGDSNFPPATGSSTLTVTPAPLTVMVNNVRRVQGTPNHAFTVSYQGFANGDGPSSLGGQLTFQTVATAASPPGDYSVTVSGLTSNNYEIDYQPGTLTIVSAQAKYQADLRQAELDLARFGLDLTVAFFVAFGEETGPLWAATVVAKAASLGINIAGIYGDIQAARSNPTASNYFHLAADAASLVFKTVEATFFSLGSDVGSLAADAVNLAADQQAILATGAG